MNRPTDARACLVPADFHEGSCRDFLRRHERESAVAANRTGRGRTEFARCLFRRAADSRNLRCSIDYLASEGGSSPGPNGLTLDDLDSTERWELARALGEVIRTGRYRPGPHLEVRIPKGPGRGLRTLRIRNVEDRVVERAIVQVIQPFLDPTFAPTSFGYRPGRSRERALAFAEAKADSTSAWVWTFEDVKDAFEHVPLGRLLDFVGKRLAAEGIVELIRIVTDAKATKGIRQGSSLSPLLLNLYLDHQLDHSWAKRHPANPLIRVADDLLVIARDRSEAESAHEDLRSRLRSVGLNLKAIPGTTVRDLRHGETGDWLGFRLRNGPGCLEIRPTDLCWGRLEEILGLAHTKPSAPLRAFETIEGWTEQLGPCRPHLDPSDLLERIASVAHEHAFDEIPAGQALEGRLFSQVARPPVRKRRRRWPASTHQISSAGAVSVPPHASRGGQRQGRHSCRHRLSPRWPGCWPFRIRRRAATRICTLPIALNVDTFGAPGRVWPERQAPGTAKSRTAGTWPRWSRRESTRHRRDLSTGWGHRMQPGPRLRGSWIQNQLEADSRRCGFPAVCCSLIPVCDLTERFAGCVPKSSLRSVDSGFSWG